MNHFKNVFLSFKKSIGFLSLTALLIIQFSGSKVYSQTNFNLEWESDIATLGYWYGITFMNQNSNVPQLIFVEADFSVYRIIDGATKSLLYTINAPGDLSYYQFPYKPNYNLYQPIDVNNDGIFEMFNILDPYYTGGTEYSVKVINGANGNMLHDFSFTVDPTSLNYLYTFDVDGDGFTEIMIYTNGTLKIYSTASSVSVPNTSEMVTDFRLGQNYPNPFNPSTTIEYSLGNRAEIKLVIHDILGRELKYLNMGIQNEGTYTVRLSDLNLPSGTYFYTVIVDNKPFTKKMVKLK